MTEIITAVYDKGGNIIVTIEDQPPGTSIVVPDDMANMDRQAVAEWEAAGNTITPYLPPPPPFVGRGNYDAMLDRRIEAALAAGDTEGAIQDFIKKGE